MNPSIKIKVWMTIQLYSTRKKHRNCRNHWESAMNQVQKKSLSHGQKGPSFSSLLLCWWKSWKSTSTKAMRNLLKSFSVNSKFFEFLKTAVTNGYMMVYFFQNNVKLLKITFQECLNCWLLLNQLFPWILYLQFWWKR